MPTQSLVVMIGTQGHVIDAVRSAAPGITLLIASSVNAARSLLGALARTPPDNRADPTIDELTREVHCAGRVLALSTQEFRILSALAKPVGAAWSFAELYERAWDGAYLGDSSSIRSAIKRIRRKLRNADSDWDIESVRGFGMRLVSGARQTADERRELSRNADIGRVGY